MKRNQGCVKNDKEVYHLYNTIKREVKDLSPYIDYTFTVILENDFGLGMETIFKEETREDGLLLFCLETQYKSDQSCKLCLRKNRDYCLPEITPQRALRTLWSTPSGMVCG